MTETEAAPAGLLGLGGCRRAAPLGAGCAPLGSDHGQLELFHELFVVKTNFQHGLLEGNVHV